MRSDDAEAALASYFARNDVPIPRGPAPLIERLGLAVFAADCWIAADFHITCPGSAPHVLINGSRFEGADIEPAIGPGLMLARVFSAAFSPPDELAATPEQVSTRLVDRMAALLLDFEAEAQDCEIAWFEPHGIPEHDVVRLLPAATQIAKAMDFAVEAYLVARRARANATSEAA